jgi:hypothetical protein
MADVIIMIPSTRSLCTLSTTVATFLFSVDVKEIINIPFKGILYNKEDYNERR